MYDYFAKWQKDGVFAQLTGALRRLLRQREGKEAERSACVIDTQSVKTSTSVPAAGQGTHATKEIVDRKRSIVTDTLGLPGQGDTLPLAAGQFRRPGAAPAGEAHGFEQGAGLVPAPPDSQQDVVLDAAPGQQPVLLEHHSCRDRFRPGTLEPDRSGARLFEPGDDPQQGALARATGAEYGDERSGLDLEVEALQDPSVAEPPSHTLQEEPGPRPGGIHRDAERR
ncbi:mobile element protein [Streptomyces sparsogenes DSM 40356]|uniref:Mobile element protein n=1 Tax=Streptomyces sparsogenes DSM 40356 TaxID=1331668 RepID=A0A1R1SB10_9ACTN|nr:mobile element protein [Streptomyces sparsogenes DSM 40356]